MALEIRRMSSAELICTGRGSSPERLNPFQSSFHPLANVGDVCVLYLTVVVRYLLQKSAVGQLSAAVPMWPLPIASLR